MVITYSLHESLHTNEWEDVYLNYLLKTFNGTGFFAIVIMLPNAFKIQCLGRKVVTKHLQLEVFNGQHMGT